MIEFLLSFLNLLNLLSVLNVLIFLIASTFLLSHCILFLQGLHMFQLNAYKPGVQLRWIAKNKAGLLRKNILAFLVFPFLSAPVHRRNMGLFQIC